MQKIFPEEGGVIVAQGKDKTKNTGTGHEWEISVRLREEKMAGTHRKKKRTMRPHTSGDLGNIT